MAKKYRNQHHARSQQQQPSVQKHPILTTHHTVLPETSDTGDGIGQDSVYAASGAATGGGVDLPMTVERSTEAEVQKSKPLNQGSSANAGGGADNGSDL